MQKFGYNEIKITSMSVYRNQQNRLKKGKILWYKNETERNNHNDKADNIIRDNGKGKCVLVDIAILVFGQKNRNSFNKQSKEQD